ncbi:MAG: DNA-processing protein DprA [Bacteroidetes bacterium]|nr:DNA-processing protein DprA [Bacteroidota bacterium]
MLEGIGAVQAKNLISYCGGVEAVFKQKKSQLLKIPGIGPITADNILKGTCFKQAEEEIEFTEKNNIEVLPYTSSKYPKRLTHCTDSPLLLYKKGSANLNYAKTISIVGTRKATKYGKDFIIQLCEDLKNNEIQIISGLALGIDGQAHKSALDNKLSTVAVLGHSLNTIYPSLHKNLAEDIVKNNGALLSEYPSFEPMHPSNFPMRNRIVAGMSDAVIVVESAVKGGAIITANIANSYNRDVFALPGRYKDKYSAGCNFLIKTNKSHLIENANDLLNIMGWQTNVKKPKQIQRQLAIDLSEDEQKVIATLKDTDGLEVDLLMVKTNINGSMLAAILLELELKGIIYSLPGNRYILS